MHDDELIVDFSINELVRQTMRANMDLRRSRMCRDLKLAVAVFIFAGLPKPTTIRLLSLTPETICLLMG
jgi:hypothetical protein